MSLRAVEIDTSPASLAAMLEAGFLHSHPDGRWRYSPHGGETVHVTDPTQDWPDRSPLIRGWGAVALPSAGLYACLYGDGTRGLHRWTGRELRVWQMYGPRHEGEREQRAWIAAAFGAKGNA